MKKKRKSKRRKRRQAGDERWFWGHFSTYCSLIISVTVLRLPRATHQKLPSPICSSPQLNNIPLLCLLTLGGRVAPSGNSFHKGAWFSLSSALSVPKKRQFLEEVWMASCPASQASHPRFVHFRPDCTYFIFSNISNL